MSQTHANRPTQNHQESAEETEIPSKNIDTDKIKADMDELDRLLDEVLLDEIDEMLEDGTSMETAVKFTQKGGQ